MYIESVVKKLNRNIHKDMYIQLGLFVNGHVSAPRRQTIGVAVGSRLHITFVVVFRCRMYYVHTKGSKPWGESRNWIPLRRSLLTSISLQCHSGNSSICAKFHGFFLSLHQ